MNLKKPSGALLSLLPRDTNLNSDNTRTGGCSTSDDNADNVSECGDDGHNNNNNDESIPITGKCYASHQFWNYVDDYLSLVHTESFQHIPDPVARRTKIVWYALSLYFAHTLIASQGSSMRHCKSTCSITRVA